MIVMITFLELIIIISKNIQYSPTGGTDMEDNVNS